MTHNINAINFSIFGLDLVEPNVLITDILLGILSIFFAIRISKLSSDHTFYKNWKRFLLLFGIATILGGFGHAFINYFGIFGKIPAWILGVIAVHFIETSMISVIPSSRWYKTLSIVSYGKLILALLVILGVLILYPPMQKGQLSMIIVIANTFFGVFFFAGVLGYQYFVKGFSQFFNRMVTGVFILIPSSAVFLFEINLFRWFDKNDLSHMILGIGITFFYHGVIRIHEQRPKILQQA